MSQKLKTKEHFPILLFSIYIIFYGGQALQSAYQSLYLNQLGFTPSQIGQLISVSTVVILLLQTYFGWLSDSTPTKNRVLTLLYIGSFIFSLLFFASTNYWVILVLLALFGGFYMPIIPLTDNLAVSLVQNNQKYDYGIVRMGGTIGYCIMTLVSGYFLNDNYRPIFLIIASTLFIAFLLLLKLPKVPNRETAKKKSGQFLKVILKNKIFLVLITFNLLNSIGESFFYSYYSIYFLEIGGNSKLVGILMFFCAVSEIPCLFLIGRFVKRFGVGKVLSACAAVAFLRWTILYFITTPVLSIAICTLHGVTYSGINYCMVNYIGKHVEDEAKASSQVFKNTVSTIFSRVILGFAGGYMYEILGPRSLLLVSALIIGSASVFMYFWSRGKEAALEI